MSTDISTGDGPKGTVVARSVGAHRKNPTRGVIDFNELPLRGVLVRIKRFFVPVVDPATVATPDIELQLSAPIRIGVFGIEPKQTTIALSLAAFTLAHHRDLIVSVVDMASGRGRLANRNPDMRKTDMTVLELDAAILRSTEENNTLLGINELKQYGTSLKNLLMFSGINPTSWGMALSLEQKGRIFKNLNVACETVVVGAGSTFDQNTVEVLAHIDQLCLVLDFSESTLRESIDTLADLFEPMVASGTLPPELEHVKDVIQNAILVFNVADCDSYRADSDILPYAKRKWQEVFGVKETFVMRVPQDKHIDDIPVILSKVPQAARSWESICGEAVRRSHEMQNQPAIRLEPLLTETDERYSAPALAIVRRVPKASNELQPESPRYSGVVKVRRTVATAAALGAASLGFFPQSAVADPGSDQPLSAVTSVTSGDGASAIVETPPSEVSSAPVAPSSAPAANEPGNGGVTVDTGSSADNTPVAQVEAPPTAAPEATRSQNPAVKENNRHNKQDHPTKHSAVVPEAQPSVVVPSSPPSQVQPDVSKPADANPASAPAVVQPPIGTYPSVTASGTKADVVSGKAAERRAPVQAQTTRVESLDTSRVRSSQATTSAPTVSATGSSQTSTRAVPQFQQESGSAVSAPPMVGTVFVTNGDSLWKIAENALQVHLGRAPSPAEIERYWHQIYKVAENHQVIGEDPDLILPGQRLELPAY